MSDAESMNSSETVEEVEMGEPMDAQSQEEAQSAVMTTNKTGLQVKRGDGGNTYTFTNEDHTLGNCLRSILTNNPDVEMAGYSIVHPSENRMNIRIQGQNCDAAMASALTDLQGMSKTLSEKFRTAIGSHHK